MNEDLIKVWEQLRGRFNLGTYEQFEKRMQNPENRKMLIDRIQSYQISIELPESVFGAQPKKEKLVSTPNQQQAATQQPSRKKTELEMFDEAFAVKSGEALPEQETGAPPPVAITPRKGKEGPLSLAEPTASADQKVMTGLESVPMSDLYSKIKQFENQLLQIEQNVKQYDQFFNEWNTKVSALQQELSALQPTLKSASSKYTSAFEQSQSKLKEKESALNQLSEQHKAAKTPEQANAIANKYNALLAEYTEQAKQANVELAKVAPTAVVARYNAVIRELNTLQNDPTVKERIKAIDLYNNTIGEYQNYNAELSNRNQTGPIKTFTMTTPAYQKQRRDIIAKNLPPEERLQTLEQRLFSPQKEYNAFNETTAKINGFESFEEMRMATAAGLTEADLRQRANPPTKEQTDAITAFLGENYQDIPASDKVELERYLIELAGKSPESFWRTVRLSTPDSPLVGIGKAALLGGMSGISATIDKADPSVKASTKARLLEEAYVSKLSKMKESLSNIEQRISNDPALLEDYRVLADGLTVINDLQDKKNRTEEENIRLDEAYNKIGSLQTPEVKEYAAILSQYQIDYKNLSNVVTYFPEELVRRTLLDFKNQQLVIKPEDNAATKVAKQIQAIKGAAGNTALRIAGTTLKTIAAMPDRIARAITSQEYTSTAERFFEETGKFLETAVFLPELPEDMRSSIAMDLMGRHKIRPQSILPGIATGLVQMGALVYGGQAAGAVLGSGAAGLTASGFVFEFNDMYEDFLKEGLSSRAALGLASGISFAVARMELISPQGVGLSLFDQTVKGAVKKLAAEGVKDFGPAFAKGSMHLLRELGLENLQEFSQDGVKTISNYLINKAYGTNLSDEFELPQISETALITTGTTLIFTLLTGKSQMQGEAYEAAKYLVEKPEQLEAELQRRVSSGRMDAEAARKIFNYVQDVKKQEDAIKAKEAFDKKIEGNIQGKPILEDYKGPTEITAEEYYASDYKVPSGVIVDLDGVKYEVTNNDKGTTLTIVELAEEQKEGGNPTVIVKPTKEKLTVEEFNERFQAPQGERVADEVKIGNVAQYKGKEYQITQVAGGQVTLENYAGTARMTVPQSNVQAFAVRPLATYTYKGRQFSINSDQQARLADIDQIEQSLLDEAETAAKKNRIKANFDISRRQLLGEIPSDPKVGDQVFLKGRPVTIKSKRGSKVTVDMEGTSLSVEATDLSLFDDTDLIAAQAKLKEKVAAPAKGHIFKVKGGVMNKEDQVAYMRTNSATAAQIKRAERMSKVLPDLEIEVYENEEQAKQAALDAGAPEVMVRGFNVRGRDIVDFEELNETESQVTYENGETELVPTMSVKANTFGGFWDGKRRIVINATQGTNTTVAHEILHPVIESILSDKPEIVTKFFDQLKNEPDYERIRSFVEQYDANTQPIEALVEFTARIVMKEFDFKKRKASFKRKVVDFFKSLFKRAGEDVNINTDNVLDFADSLAKYFEKGIEFRNIQLQGQGRFQRLAPTRSQLSNVRRELEPDLARELPILETFSHLGDETVVRGQPVGKMKLSEMSFSKPWLEEIKTSLLRLGDPEINLIQHLADVIVTESAEGDIRTSINEIGGEYVPHSGNIYVNVNWSQRDIEEVIMHEFIHFFTIEFMRNNPKHPSVKKLVDYSMWYASAFQVESKLNDTSKLSSYGLSNELEFVTEILTNPEFFKTINYIEKKYRPSEKSIWKSIWAAISRMLGIKQSDLKKIQKLAWEIIEAQHKSKGEYQTNKPVTINTIFVDRGLVRSQMSERRLAPNGSSNPDIRFQRLTAEDFSFLGPAGQKNFKKWVGDRPILTDTDIQEAKTGEPFVARVYHGTTNDFYEFDASVKGNIEGYLGKVHYFTSDYQDASSNYTSGGPDITLRIDTRADEIEQYLEYEGFDIEEIKDQFNITDEELESIYPSGVPEDIELQEIAYYIAERELKGGEDKVLEVFVKLNNPVVIGGPNAWYSIYDRSDFEEYIDEAAQEIADENDITVEEAKEDYSWDVDMRASELAGISNPLVDALTTAIQNNTYDYEWAASKASEVLADFYETDVNLSQLERRLREELLDAKNEEGQQSSFQIVADFFEELGFDGVVLTDVSKRFPGMGLGSGTSHIHVFDKNANQIKLADGSNVDFGPSRDIRFQRTNEQVQDDNEQTDVIQKAIEEGVITFTDAKGNPCARGGFKQKKVKRGGTWELIEEFSGKSHEQGGIDIEIKDGRITTKRGETQLEAKYGLLIESRSRK